MIIDVLSRSLNHPFNFDLLHLIFKQSLSNLEKVIADHFIKNS